MTNVHEQTRFARRHSWQPIQDGLQVPDEGMEFLVDSGGCHEDASSSVITQREGFDINQTQLDGGNVNLFSNQEHKVQAPATANKGMQHQQSQLHQDGRQQSYKLPRIEAISGLLFPNDQKAAHDYRRRVSQLPQLALSYDTTIAQVEQNREWHIAQLLCAVYDMNNVLDKPNSRERKMFSRNPSLTEYVEPFIVEAACRCVFDILLDRCYNGFRGSLKDNHGTKPSDGREPDRDALCSERLENVLEVLRYSKCACRDILYEDYKIMLLVNHPLYCLKKKKECRRNNEHKRNMNLKAKAVLKEAEAQYNRPQTVPIPQIANPPRLDSGKIDSPALNRPYHGYPVKYTPAMNLPYDKLPAPIELHQSTTKGYQPQHMAAVSPTNAFTSDQLEQCGASERIELTYRDAFSFQTISPAKAQQHDIVPWQHDSSFQLLQHPSNFTVWADGNPGSPGSELGFDLTASKPTIRPPRHHQPDYRGIGYDTAIENALEESIFSPPATQGLMIGRKRSSTESYLSSVSSPPEVEDERPTKITKLDEDHD